MTKKVQKIEKLKKLADAMYYAAQYLTTDASRLHKAMDEYHQFIIHEWREEPVSDECIYNRTLEERQRSCKFCSAACQVRIKEEPVSEGLEEELPKIWDRETLDEYAYQVAYDLSNDWARETATWHDVETAVKLGAKWKENHLWKPADSDDLPEIDREVIALLDNGKVVFAHRPPEFWDGKDIVTGKVTRNYPKTYDKGGWNIPNVKYWLDCSMPKEIEL